MKLSPHGLPLVNTKIFCLTLVPEGIDLVAINRPEKRNAFRPQTISELCDAFIRIREDPKIGWFYLQG